jgi:KilA-N domain
LAPIYLISPLPLLQSLKLSRASHIGINLIELSSDIGIPISDLVQSIKGGIPSLQGTWVHPQIAIHLAQWLSAKFAVQVSKWILEWMSGNIPKTSLPYHLRRYVANLGVIPHTHFSILQMLTIDLIAPLEQSGYTLPENLVPDISEGRMFADWLRKEKNLDLTDFPRYKHRYEDGRVVDARLYPNELLHEFKTHFHEVWMPKRSVGYFSKKDSTAIPHLTKILRISYPNAEPIRIK